MNLTFAGASNQAGHQKGVACESETKQKSGNSANAVGALEPMGGGGQIFARHRGVCLSFRQAIGSTLFAGCHICLGMQQQPFSVFALESRERHCLTSVAYLGARPKHCNEERDKSESPPALQIKAVHAEEARSDQEQVSKKEIRTAGIALCPLAMHKEARGNREKHEA
ncbi:MAG: hypothetical protein E5W69_05720 [Mesorhizobium sp.]|nr:MAG: hypothetical protein E5W69_05720 [Mesorhizobium sp.]